MKILNYTLLNICIFLCTPAAFGQLHFINGGLEPATTSTVMPCRNNDALRVNTMGNVWKTKDKPDSLYVGDDATCAGSAKEGHHFIGLYYGKGSTFKGNRIVLELDGTMLAGHTYSFFYWIKGATPVVGTGAKMDWGWNNNTDSIKIGTPDSTGDVSGSIDTSINYDNAWHRVDATVTPGINTKYVWIGAAPKTTADTGIIYVDYFFMHYAGDHVERVNVNNEIEVYPNPYKESTQIILSPAVLLPCNYIITNITGGVVVRQDNIQNKNIKIDRVNMPTGLYFLKVTDRDKKVYQTKLIAE